MDKEHGERGGYIDERTAGSTSRAREKYMSNERLLPASNHLIWPVYDMDCSYESVLVARLSRSCFLLFGLPVRLVSSHYLSYCH